MEDPRGRLVQRLEISRRGDVKVNRVAFYRISHDVTIVSVGDMCNTSKTVHHQSPYRRHQNIIQFNAVHPLSGDDIQGSLLSFCVVGVGVTKKFCHIFLWNHTGQLLDIWHKALVWRSVSCNAFLNLPHVHSLLHTTFNIVVKGKFAHKIIR